MPKFMESDEFDFLTGAFMGKIPKAQGGPVAVRMRHHQRICKKDRQVKCITGGFAKNAPALVQSNLTFFTKKRLYAGQRTAVIGERRLIEIEQIILGIDRQRRYNENKKRKGDMPHGCKAFETYPPG